MLAEPCLADEYLMRRWRHLGLVQKMLINHFKYAECIRKWVHVIHPDKEEAILKKMIP